MVTLQSPHASRLALAINEPILLSSACEMNPRNLALAIHLPYGVQARVQIISRIESLFVTGRNS